MATAFRDDAHVDEWGGRLRCALKLVKLAAGPFEAKQVLSKSRQPSWRTASVGSSSPCGNKIQALSAPLSCNNRQNWSRPWREGRSCREVRWEKAGITTPRQAPASLSTGNVPHRATIRRIYVEVPSVPQASPRPEYTTKYFGLVDGALAIMSKVDQLDHRPARSPLSPDSWPVSPEKATERRRRGFKTRTHRVSETPLDVETPCTPYDEVPRTAEEPPATKPVEAPQPPPWSESKVLVASNGSAVVAEGLQVAVTSVCEKSRSNDWGSEIMIHSEADRGHTENSYSSNNDDDNHCNSNRCSHVTAGEAEYRGTRHRVSGSDGFIGYDASSFPSLAIESSPWTVSDEDEDESEDGRNDVQWLTKPAIDVPVTLVTELAPVEAATNCQNKQETHAQNLGKTNSLSCAATVGKVIPMTVASLGEGRNTREGYITNHDKNRPRPELYDVWIPQQYFQGKALTPSKRWRDTEPGESALVVQVSEVAGVGPKPTRSRPGQRKASPPAGSIPTAPSMKNCREKVVVVEDDVDRGESSSSLQLPPSATMTLSWTFPGERKVTSGRRVSPTASCGKNDGNSEFEVADGGGRNSSNSTTLIVDNPLWHLDGDMGAREGGEDEEENDRWQEEDGEEGQEYFDYAKTFSWRTAAEVVAEVTTAQRVERPRVVQQGSGDEEFRVISQEKTAVTERARIRSEQATRVAVGRLRAPQSVFNASHRTPSRPEMRRSITHGRFSPVGRKLWRQSAGLSPRAGQLCLRAVPPPGRITQSPAALDVPWGSDAGLITPSLSCGREESQFGGSSVGPEGSGCLVEEAIEMETEAGPSDRAAVEAVEKDDARSIVEEGDTTGDMETIPAGPAVVRVPQTRHTAGPSNRQRTPPTIVTDYGADSRRTCSHMVVDNCEHGRSMNSDLNGAAEVEPATVRGGGGDASGSTGQHPPTTTWPLPHGAPVTASTRCSVTIPSCMDGTFDPWSP